MIRDTRSESAEDQPSPDTVLPRVFLREPGWQVTFKVGSERAFCYQMTPGEKHYHRLQDGEILIVRGDERLCLPCAERRGLLNFVPRILRDQLAGIQLDGPADETDAGYDLRG